jgi:hypothetical protein
MRFLKSKANEFMMGKEMTDFAQKLIHWGDTEARAFLELLDTIEKN